MRFSQIIFCFLFVSSCITPYNEEPSSFQESIIVQGMITDQPGPYRVIVSRTIPVNAQYEDAGLVSGASVQVIDDQGNSEDLVEKSPGSFYTSAFQGVVGN